MNFIVQKTCKSQVLINYNIKMGSFGIFYLNLARIEFFQVSDDKADQ